MFVSNVSTHVKLCCLCEKLVFSSLYVRWPLACCSILKRAVLQTCGLAALSEKEMDDRLEYEMDEQDMEFVSKTLQQQFKLVLNEDKFEQIIDRLEKESAKLVREFFQ
jgi:hypothetical protein